MIGLAGRDFEPKVVWNSAADDIVGGFYRPALRGCVRYDRLAGFFDSNTFAVAVREVMDFVERGGRMRLITSAKFSRADLDVIKKSVDDRLLEDVSAMLDDDMGKKCLGLFAHMLTNKIDGRPQLDMRILVPQRGIFHAKVGVFEMMNGDVVSFSGSVNETGMGWIGNIEEFKVFCSWTHGEIVGSDVDSFNRFWNGNHAGIRSFSLPHAVREKILSVKPGSDAEYRRLVSELMVDLDAERGGHPRRVLRNYQAEAVDAWATRGCRGILEMPTATGKTFTAMGCINRMQYKTGRLFTVIVVPYTHLAQQWIDKVREWNGKVGPDERISPNTLITSGSGWQAALGRAVNDFNRTKFDGSHIIDDYIVCTTYDTLSASQFIERICRVEGKMLLVADEAHHAGAKTARNGLLGEYSGRLALTATPERYFDEEGSDIIRDYFNGVAFSMEIKTAIDGGHLIPYDYHPRFVELTADETKEYARLTRAIAAKRAAKKDEESDEGQNNPENRRATLVAKMENKYAELAAILAERGGSLEHALIYCRDKEQMNGVGKVLSGLNINFEVVTGGDSMAERWNRIRSLEMKNHQCIVSMKCLDEGVDIPSASLGIILASTGNNREYIQRRGRLLRHSDGKDHATIYDLLATAIPKVDCKPYAKKLVAKELLRHKEFADAARNRREALGKIRPVAERLGIDLDRLDLDYVLSL